MGKRADRISDAFERVILSRVKSKNIFAEYYNRTDKKVQWKRQVTSYSAKEIKDWKLAVMAFTDPENPRAGEWMRFRQSLLLDNHLASVIDTRILRVIRSSYKIVNEKTGEENEVLKELLERPWHDDLIRLVVGKIFNGRTLIEMFDTDDNGELVRVTEIPQSNFIPQKGIIVKDEYDTNGVSFVDGIYKDYYLQVGGDWEIGMLNELAMIVLAKKLGLGSWMSYIDTLGIPPIFAITDRMDTARRDELFEMLQDFRSNRFVVLQGQEKIEVPDYSTDAYQSFKALNEFCDNQLTKRVLGGTALTDEKAFVGTASIQEKMMLDRYESDKQFYKYIFNQFIRQRLAKISSVYADFATHKIVWDNQETLNIVGYIDAIQKLSTAFEFDPEEISKRTGLPIIGVKAITPPDPNNDPQKKKPSGSVKNQETPLLYGISSNQGISSRTWDDATERLANDLWSGKIKPEDLDKDLVLKNYSILSKAAATGWSDQYYDNDKARLMRENLIKFSGYKTYNLMSAIAEGKEGKTKDEFIEHAKKVVNLHNETYINVERNFTSAKASAARDYLRYLEDSDIYPNLKLRTMEDDEVRPEHAALDGLVKKIKDWVQVPPFDPGCRCRLEQTTEPVSAHIPTYQFNEQYANNPGITGEAFTKYHSYFKNVGKGLGGTISDSYNTIKQYAPYNKEVKTKGDNSIFVSDFYDRADFDSNLENIKIASDCIGKNAYIMAHDNTTGKKNPEYGIDKPSVLGDLKTYEPIRNGKPVTITKFLKNNLKKAEEQGCEWVIINVDKVNNDDFVKMANKLRGELSNKHSYKEGIKNIVIIRNGNAGKLTREQINSKKYMDYFNNLFE